MTEEPSNEMDSSNHEVAVNETVMADAPAEVPVDDGPPPRLMITKMVRLSNNSFCFTLHGKKHFRTVH